MYIERLHMVMLMGLAVVMRDPETENNSCCEHLRARAP